MPRAPAFDQSMRNDAADREESLHRVLHCGSWARLLLAAWREECEESAGPLLVEPNELAPVDWREQVALLKLSEILQLFYLLEPLCNRQFIQPDHFLFCQRDQIFEPIRSRADDQVQVNVIFRIEPRMDGQFVDGDAKEVVNEDTSEPAWRSEMWRRVKDQLNFAEWVFRVRVAGEKVPDQFTFQICPFNLETRLRGRPLDASFHKSEGFGISCEEVEVVGVSVLEIVAG